MKIIKILFSIIALLIVVCALAVCSLIYFVDPNKLKPVIIEEVKKETGYQLVIEGELSWSFYPRAAVKIDSMTLSAPNQAQPFIDASNIRIATDFVDLLKSKESLQGDIQIANIRLTNIHAENVSATLSWKNNILTLNPIKASLYEGTLEGVASGRDFATAPHWQWDMQGNGIQVKSLLQDVNSVDSKIKITGTGSIKLQAETRGITREQMFSQLSGVSEFSLTNGAVEGIDINYFLQTANALLNKEATSEPVNTNQTAFNSLTGTINIKNGVANTNDLLLTAASFTTKAQGTIELISRALDFKLQIKPQLENAKIHWDIPVLITGDLYHPDVRVDTSEIQKKIAGIELDELKQKAVKQIQKHVHGKAGEFLQNLLGN